MKKLMMLAALLAMVLVAAAPALAQQGDDGTNQETSSLQACLAAFGDQAAGVEQNVSGDENETGAAIGQEQAQECEQVIQNALADDGSVASNANDVTVEEAEEDAVVSGDDSEASAAAAASASASADAEGESSDSGSESESESSEEELPATGGASLLALGAGALLIAGGLVARRIVG